MKKIVFSLFISFFIFQNVHAQKILFSGSVYGFLGDKVLLVRKASKNVSFEGPMSGAKLTIKGKSGTTTVVTDIIGAYSFSIPEVGDYTIEVVKDGYSSASLNLNYKSAGDKTQFIATSFILKKEDNTINALGNLIIDNSGKLDFMTNTVSQKKSGNDVMLSNKVLFEKAMSINNASKKNVGPKKQEPLPISINTTVKGSSSILKIMQKRLSDDSITKAWSKELFSVTSNLSINSNSSIEDIKKEIEKSKETLSQLDPNSDNYALLTAQIINAENQLQVKEALITSQKEEISTTRKKMIYLGLFALSAVVALLLVWQFLQQKKKHNAELNEKNKNISKINTKLLSSIRYASVIQSNFFKDKKNIQNLFSNSFIYNQPKDFLSGDFYWFGEKNGRKIIAVADCTGHGVPGALLTILGHGILEDLVNVQEITLPSKLLMELNKAIMSAFSNQQQVEYNIDITIVSIDNKQNTVLFSGIANGLYHFSNNVLQYHKVTAKSLGSLLTANDVQDQEISIKPNDALFLCTDGLADQFGGNDKKKFNLKNLQTLLAEISKQKQLNACDETLNKAMQTWKGSNEQTDDVLVVGIKI